MAWYGILEVHGFIMMMFRVVVDCCIFMMEFSFGVYIPAQALTIHYAITGVSAYGL